MKPINHWRQNKGDYKKRDIWNKTTEDINEEFNKDMENFRRKTQTETLEIKSSLIQIKNTGKCHSSWLDQWKTESQDLKTK
jgi:hypothetical protein